MNTVAICGALIAAVVAAIIYWGQLGAMEAQLEAMKKQLEELKQSRFDDQRAWVVPRGAEIVSRIELGQTLEFAVIYENIGKQPAERLLHNQTIGALFVPLDDREIAYWETMPLPENETCTNALEQAPSVENTAFAGQQYKVISYAFTDDKGIPNDFIDRKLTIFIQGCFAYRTLSEFDTAPYCFYIYPAKGADPDTWEFRSCPPPKIKS